MKKPFIGHVSSKIIEGRYEKALSLSAANSVLKHVEEVAEIIRQKNGSEAVENVLYYAPVKRCLLQCINYIEDETSAVNDEDFRIYYAYMTQHLKIAQTIIDTELHELGL